MLKSWLEAVTSGTEYIDYSCLMANSFATTSAVESLVPDSTMKVDFSISNNE